MEHEVHGANMLPLAAHVVACCGVRARAERWFFATERGPAWSSTGPGGPGVDRWWPERRVGKAVQRVLGPELEIEEYVSTSRVESPVRP